MTKMPIAKDMIARVKAWMATGCYKSDSIPSADPEIYYLVCTRTGERIDTSVCKDCPYVEPMEY